MSTTADTIKLDPDATYTDRALASALGVLLFVRETRPPTGEARPRGRPPALREAFAHPIISRIMIISFVIVSGFAGIEATYGLWTEARFGWGPREIGLAFMVIGVIGAFAQGMGTAALVRRFGEGFEHLPAHARHPLQPFLVERGECAVGRGGLALCHSRNSTRRAARSGRVA